jgi:hypothetical protein
MAPGVTLVELHERPRRLVVVAEIDLLRDVPVRRARLRGGHEWHATSFSGNGDRAVRDRDRVCAALLQQALQVVKLTQRIARSSQFGNLVIALEPPG